MLIKNEERHATHVAVSMVFITHDVVRIIVLLFSQLMNTGAFLQKE